MKRNKTKLTLHKETVRSLSEVALENVRGGLSGSNQISNCNCDSYFLFCSKSDRPECGVTGIKL